MAEEMGEPAETLTEAQEVPFQPEIILSEDYEYYETEMQPEPGGEELIETIDETIDETAAVYAENEEFYFTNPYDRVVNGQVGVPVSFQTDAVCSCSGLDHVEIEWWNDRDDMEGSAILGKGTSFTYTPVRSQDFLVVKALAYDVNHEEICAPIYSEIYLQCARSARVINRENHIKVGRGRPVTLKVSVSGVTGRLKCEWKTKPANGDNDSWDVVRDAEGLSYTIASCTDTGYVYECDVNDEEGYVGKAFFDLEFCVSHAGNWIRKKAPTIFSEGEEERTCTLCGTVEKRSVAKKTSTLVLNVTGQTVPMKIGQTVKKVRVESITAGDSIVSWSSSNPGVAAVSSSGVLKAKKKTGTAVITATTAAGASSGFSVRVRKGAVKAGSITVYPGKATLKKGTKLKLTVTVLPISAASKPTFRTSNKRVAVVSRTGMITAKGK